MKGKQKEWKRWALRGLIYFAGMWMISAGIVLCVKSDLGVSPISSVPYVLSLASSMTLGTYTMLFHYMNTLFQYITEKKLWNPQVLLQIPIASVFGWMIDFLKSRCTFPVTSLETQILCLVFSIFFTAFGMVFMVNMQLVQNPPDGTVKTISAKCCKEMGKVKIAYDCFMMLLSILLSRILLGRVEGFGAGTICSAFFVGKTLSVLQKCAGQKLKNYIFINKEENKNEVGIIDSNL
ncbi:MAG: DUF6198 family protein [Eubacteriales bacterium]|nr:DUF6198 family protein [Eubacteriales bacterium]